MGRDAYSERAAAPPPVSSGLIAYVLAGGRGSRLSAEKGFLEVGGAPIVERVLAAAAPLAREVVLVGDPLLLRSLGRRVITEESRFGGPLAAVCAALADAHPLDALIVPWDAPFLTTAALACLVAGRGSADAAVPRRGELFEPLCAVYGPGCLNPARAAFEAGRRRGFDFYDDVDVRWVGEEELAACGAWEQLFLNVNTPQDLARARRLARLEERRTG
ncbi:MAG: molybdenum cofactor guanylyltransferase [Armatimonadetes bacterium]|nr:molybdenum cofactor guanylyltransferase [Armatimonadota bacterium]